MLGLLYVTLKHGFPLALTEKGLDAIGRRIANMTIGELEAMLDLQNIDPFIVVQLMKDLRALYRTFVSVITLIRSLLYLHEVCQPAVIHTIALHSKCTRVQRA